MGLGLVIVCEEKCLRPSFDYYFDPLSEFETLTLDMGLDDDFQTAQDLVSNKINKTLSNDELLEIYALFKQASVGDCNTSRPGMMDFKASHTWASLGLSIILNVFFSG